MTAIAYLPDGRELAVGVHHGIPAAIYHELPGVSQSQLKILRDRSPAHLRHYLDNPPEPSAAMTLGEAIHDAVLLPDTFDRLWVRAPEGDRRTKAAKEAWARVADEHPGATLLKSADYDTCLAVRDAIAAHPKARALLVGDAEQSAFWNDEDTGLVCRARFDLVGHRTGTIVDLKTARSAAKPDFSRAIYQYGYWIQGGFYLDGARALGLDCDRFVMIAAEKEPPFGIAVFELVLDALADGRAVYRRLLDTYARCVETGEWPGYDTDVMLIDVPRWAPGQIQDELEVAA